MERLIWNCRIARHEDCYITIDTEIGFWCLIIGNSQTKEEVDLSCEIVLKLLMIGRFNK